MGVLVLITTFLLTVALGAALAKGVLVLVVRLLVEGQLPTVASLRMTAAGLLALMR